MRTHERTGLVAAVVVAAVANVSLDVAFYGHVTATVAVIPAVLAVAAMVAHIAVSAWAPAADPVLLPVTMTLNGVGLVLIRRLDLAGHRATSSLGHEAFLQLVWTAIGVSLLVLLLMFIRDYRRLAGYAYTAAAAGLVLLFLPAVLPARFSEVNGARLWLRLGGMSIQPSEFAKLLLTVFIAAYLARTRVLLATAGRRLWRFGLPRGRDLGPLAVAWAMAVLILAGEKDLGNGLLFFGIFIVVLFVATDRASWLAIGAGLFLLACCAAVMLFPHVAERVHIWLHPFRDYASSGYQLVQGQFGLAGGGITGTGIGRGQPYLVPFASTDFITSTLGEELGLSGLMATLTLYLLLSMRGLAAALRLQDDFGKLLATGLAFSLFLQVFIVVGGVSRLIPLTGKTLPFLSYGGSSLLGNYLLIALLMRLSDAAAHSASTPAPALAEA